MSSLRNMDKTTTRHLLVVAHGSRRQASNDEVSQLVARLRQLDSTFDQIGCAFLEIAEPCIEQGLLEQIAGGARDIVVMPYFLSAGRHVVNDIPEQVERVRANHPHVQIVIAAYLGLADTIPQLLIEQASIEIVDQV